ncbi:MAG: wax ester/triacylglycerol synthase family O-acyltransferase [Ilumatobacter sp.]|uniref:wax ester/triacylglycerol synthase domain-containing protein n=1 Tax=Ilumatobacter sp. TaxID=1967498 RepID=UPI00262695B9|nr:wax ester/triacylglycerol synthase domain-containing protein [Ilumatobacter sp.]MDJ0767185.1 wax ester/triacylglycerol synthase family O-acyltransferase [Ilumatobacter sp.]
MAAREREQRFAHRMSDSEALMWNVEKDPWLNPSGAALTILDKPLDMDHFLQTMRAAVVGLPRLHERVVPGIGRLATPVWVPDAEFDLGFHVRHVRLPKPGTERQLFDLASTLYQEPFERTRPLWRYVVIDGLRGGRSALWSIVHHVVADGIGQMRMAELYQQLSPDDPPPPDVDLDAVIAESVAAHVPHQLGGDLGESVFESTVGAVGHLARRQLGLARRVAGEFAAWPADPGRAVETVSDVVTAAKTTVGGAIGSGDDVPGGSPLWVRRSRHRHLEAVRTSLQQLKATSKRIDASVNDLFLAGMVEGAVRYHADRGVEVDAFNTSFVLSTRNDKAVGGNSFTPVPVQVPGGPMPFEERIADIHVRLAEKREALSHGGGMGALAGVVNLLPTSVVTRAARARAAHVDFATSNLRGAPFTLYIAGARILEMLPMGPVAGTACNATGISYDGGFGIGLFVDPIAIEEPGDFRDAVDEAFRDLVKL